MSFEIPSEAEGINEEIINPFESENDKEKAIETFRSSLFEGDIFRALQIKEEFSLNEEIFNEEKIKKAIAAGFETCLSNGDLPSAGAIMGVTSSLPNYEEVKNLLGSKIKEEIQLSLEEENFSRLLEIKRALQFDEGAFKNAEFEKLKEAKSEEYLQAKNFNQLLEVEKIFGLEEKIKNNSEFKELALQEFKICLIGNRADRASYIRSKFPENEFINSEAGDNLIEEGFRLGFLSANIDKVIDLKASFPDKKEFFNKIASEEFLACLENKNIYNLLKLKGNFSINSEALSDPRLNDFIESEFKRLLEINEGTFIIAMIKEAFPEKEQIFKKIEEQLQ